MTRSIRAPRPVLAVIAAITLAGCAVEGRPAPETPNAVRLTTEKDGRFLVLAGPNQRHAAPFLGVASTNFFLLRSFIDTQTGAIVHQLYVADSYPGAERNWSAARLAYGNALRFVAISKNEITCELNCSYAEEFAASLPDELLRTNPEGFAVVFRAKSGAEKTITVPGDIVAKQLTAVATARTARPAAAAATPTAAAASAPAPPR
jgi:hypothetical protein